MDFKIDTRDTFSVITPVSEAITVNLTDELLATTQKVRQSGSRNFIVDCCNCTSIAEDATSGIVALHEDNYADASSLVYTNLTPEIVSVLKKSEIDEQVNIAPKMIEAIDIVSMEILERDLMSEDE